MNEQQPPGNALLPDGGRYPKVTPEDVLETFVDRDDRAEPLTAPELSEELNCSRRTALNKLHTLEDAGDVASKKVGGRSRVWWVPLTAPERGGARDARERRETPSVEMDDQTLQPPRDSADVENAPDPTDTETLAEDVVETIAEGWDDTDGRLGARKDAAKAVLKYAVESGEYVGKSEAVDRFREQYPVEGQNESTWWKQNARRVLTKVGDYSRGEGGYQVDREGLEAFLEDSEVSNHA